MFSIFYDKENDDVEEGTLQSLISKKVSTGSIVCSDTWKAYTGIATQRFVLRVVNLGERQYSNGKRDHSNQWTGMILGIPENKTILKRED